MVRRGSQLLSRRIMGIAREFDGSRYVLQIISFLAKYYA
jgi:hypothetical protein